MSKKGRENRIERKNKKEEKKPQNVIKQCFWADNYAMINLYCLLVAKIDSNPSQRGSSTLYGIYIGFCPRTESYKIL